MAEESKVRDAADAVRGIVEAVPVYQDVLQPVLRDEVGRTLRGVVRVALAPLNAVIWGYDKIAVWLEARLEEKLQGVPPERIVTPPPNVAGPAIENLRFAPDPVLREMYATLLATSMDAATTAKAHPSFVEVIKQLTPDEAKIVALFASRGRSPVVSVAADLGPGKGRVDLFRHLSLLPFEAECINPFSGPIYLENLCRLGLASIPYGSFLRDQDLYADLLLHPLVTAAIAYIETPDGRSNPSVLVSPRILLGDSYYRATVERQFLDVSDFGREFAEACVAASPQAAPSEAFREMSVDEWRDRLDAMVADAAAERASAEVKMPLRDTQLHDRVRRAEEFAVKHLEVEFGSPVLRRVAVARDTGYDAVFGLRDRQIAAQIKYTENPRWEKYADMAIAMPTQFAGTGRAIPVDTLLVIITSGVTHRDADRGVAIMTKRIDTASSRAKVKVFSYEDLLRAYGGTV